MSWRTTRRFNIAGRIALMTGILFSGIGLMIAAGHRHVQAMPPVFAMLAPAPSTVGTIVSNLTSVGNVTVLSGIASLVISSIFGDMKHRREHDCKVLVDTLENRVSVAEHRVGAAEDRAFRAELLAKNLADHVRINRAKIEDNRVKIEDNRAKIDDIAQETRKVDPC